METFISRPMESKNVNMDEPPAEKSGNVTPTTGSIPITIPKLIKTCQKKIDPTPMAMTTPNRSRALAAMRMHHRISMK